MITEDYVSYEVARLLKEKGFNEPCLHYYYYNYGLELKRYFKEVTNKEWGPLGNVSAPTLQMARKWIRLTHKIHIRIIEDVSGTIYEWQIYKKGVCQRSNFVEDTYEAALEAAIKYCLENLI